MSTLEMSTLEAKSPWLVRVVDWANPILVKELRQSLKSRQFVVTFMLLVTAAWLVSVFGLLMFQTEVQYGPAGKFFFIGFYVALAISTLLIVPFNAYKSLQAERDFNTFEILSVTTITPQQIVRGRLLSALAQCLIFYSAITPFMAFSSTMQGFDAPKAAYVLVATLLASVMLSMVALMVSTLAKQRAAQGLLSLALIMPLMGAVGGAIGLGSTMIFQTWIAITNPIFWQINAAAFVLLASYFLLFQQIATANLTFESANHSTGIRITAAAQFWLVWLASFGYAQWSEFRIREEFFLALAAFSIIHWAVFGLGFTAEMDSLSRRIRRGFPDNRLVRLLMVPLLPGGGRGLIFVLIHIVALFCLVCVGLSVFASGASSWRGATVIEKTLTAFRKKDPGLLVIAGLCLHLTFYLGINTALARWGQMISDVVKPAHARVVTFLLLMAAMVGPQILFISEVVKHNMADFHILQIFDPYSVARGLARQSTSQKDEILIILTSFAALAILVNIFAMYRVTERVLKSKVRVRTPSDIAPYQPVDLGT